MIKQNSTTADRADRAGSERPSARGLVELFVVLALVALVWTVMSGLVRQAFEASSAETRALLVRNLVACAALGIGGFALLARGGEMWRSLNLPTMPRTLVFRLFFGVALAVLFCVAILVNLSHVGVTVADLPWLTQIGLIGWLGFLVAGLAVAGFALNLEDLYANLSLDKGRLRARVDHLSAQVNELRLNASNPDGDKTLAVPIGTRIELVRLPTIEVATAAGNYLEFKVGTRTITHRMSLKAFLELHGAQFVRVSRTQAVHLEHIASVDRPEGKLTLHTRAGDSLRVSLRQSARVLSRLRSSQE